jgi:ribosomal protein L40E
MASGVSMTEAVCEACGARNPVDAEFCQACGAYLRWEGAARPVTDDDLRQAQASRGSDSPSGSGRGETLTREADRTQDRPPSAGQPFPEQRPCPRCGTPSESGRRFCRRCGEPLSGQAPLLAPVPATQRPWWRRWRGTEDEAARASRAAYRRSLPMRYRATRWLLAVAVLAVAVGAFAVADRNPVGWVRGQLADLRESTEPVPVTASVLLPERVIPEYPAANVTDAFRDSYWAAPWTDVEEQVNSCSRPGDVQPGNVLTLQLDGEQPLRELWVTPAPPEGDPQQAQWWVPTAVMVTFDDGRTCARMPLEAKSEPQRLRLKQNASRVNLSVVAADAPEQPRPDSLVGLAGVELRRRGG